MDDELKALAALSLRNAFYLKFSNLCLGYLQASEGLIGFDEQKSMLGDLTSIYGTSANVNIKNSPVEIYTENKNGYTNQWDTLLEALEYEDSVQVWLDGYKVFEKHNGDWTFVGDCDGN
jgi:hypothetical protein